MKVSALEFKIGSDDAVYRARLAALEQLLPTIKGRWGGVGFAVSQAFGLGWMTESEDSVMRHVSTRAMYYPIWVVDAMCRVRCRGDNGEAQAQFITTNSAFPGNAWKPMDTLPIRAPPPRMTDSQASEEPAITPSDAPMVYQPFSPTHHLKPDVKISGDITVLPFNLSPLSLPHIFKSAGLRNSIVDMLSEGPALHINHRFTILPGVEIQVANLNEAKNDGNQANLRLDWDSLEFDMLACYPVMLPIHLVRFNYDSHGERDREATVALGAWDEGLLSYALHCDEKDGWMFKGETSWLDIDMVDFHPYIPIAPSTLDPQAKASTEASDARIVDLMAQQSQMQSVFEHRAETLIEQADWSSCMQWERDHAPAEASEESTAGLGSSIDWGNLHIRPYFEGVEENRRYIALSTEALFSCRHIEGIDKDLAKGRDVTHVQAVYKNELLSGMFGYANTTGDDAIRALRASLSEIQRRRGETRPSWMK
ncbi:hypothetical protein MEQU1_002497 [Malassezia equina]|uniref:Uncharacterized protein n=1 Tax=Malassezia equina TaxID=1381935 RepID=A0AAF0EDZ9_9BASI|nr:hypothetical protein MEQU1_002497 [Malassezia equina]